VVNSMYLAKTAGPSTSISHTYIVFLTKMQKKAQPNNPRISISQTLSLFPGKKIHCSELKSGLCA